MDDLYTICKGFADPVFIIFLLLLVSLILCFIGNKKKNGILILVLAIILLYGASIAPIANYLAYSLEKDYLRAPTTAEKNIEVIIVLSGGFNEVKALNSTFPSDEVVWTLRTENRDL